MVYEVEELIPTEVGEPNYHYSKISKKMNDKVLKENLNLLVELREVSLVRMMNQKYKMERYYNRKTKLNHFNVEDFDTKGSHYKYMELK